MEVRKVKKYETHDWLLNKHYAKRIPSIIECFGLYYNNVLNGVITFGMPPSSTLAESICGQKYAAHVIELNRLVINDNLPKNALSYFVSESIKNLKGDKIIVSFADANMNHNGYIYQACNFLYTGTSSNTTKLIDKNGQEFHFRNLGHLQKGLLKKINIANRIKQNLSNDLLKKEYLNIPNKNKYTGHCYVASECYYHLSDKNHSVYHIKHEDSTHWFLKDEKNNIIDLTAAQFKTNVPYDLAKKGFFLTKEPSKRAKILINRVLNSEFKLVKRRINEGNIDRVEVAQYLRSYKGSLTASKIDAHFGYKDTAAHWFRLDSGFSFPSVEDWIELKKLLNFDNTFDEIMTSFEWIPCAQDIVKKLQLTKVDILPKHRYVIFKGSKKFKRKCKRNIKYKLLPYPKGINKRYKCEYVPEVQGVLF